MTGQDSEENKKNPIVAEEERILKFWKDKEIFQKTLDQKTPTAWWQKFFGGARRPEFIFYEGPPTANGHPGIHHLEARAFKDVIPRYKTMRGFYVRRKGGWDTHGLPVELEVEKQLGLKSKREIETFGIAAFNQKCKESVWKYLEEWNVFTERIGFWVDQKNPYVTYHSNYIESLWNIVKHVHGRDLLYKDYKVVPWCPRCGTALSSHEIAQGYEDVKDLSVYIKFKVINPEKVGLSGNVYLLAWTTTPWTLPGNVALAVGEDIDYIFSVKDGATYILAKERAGVLGDGFTTGKEIKGKELIGLLYEPLFPYLSDLISGKEKDKLGNAFKVYPANFVTTTDGTGIVHTAVMYGQEDFELGTEIGLPKFHLVDDAGNFVKGTGEFEGLPVKNKDDNGLGTALKVIQYLEDHGNFFAKEQVTHTYPFCWRCHSPLIYYARDSWYIKMSALRDEMVKENEGINWEPDYIKDGRFGEWLREIKDWAISRERYWGTPLPVWECVACKEREVVGSLDELTKRSHGNGNHFFVMRHGEAEGNKKWLVNSRDNTINPLTDEGRQEAKQNAEKLKEKHIDLIVSSPMMRTRQTAEIVAETLGIPKEKIIFEHRFADFNVGGFEGKTWTEYEKAFPTIRERYFSAPEGGETLLDLKRRVGAGIDALNSTHTNKTILIVSHEGPFDAMCAAADGADAETSITKKRFFTKILKTGTWRELAWKNIPRNTDYELDLHRPYIDAFTLTCSCGGEMKRVPEVMDVWFDSGSMPFAQDHYPFENKARIDSVGYPADYISEAIDQTRGWFYTLHAVGTLMGKGKAFKNVICLGHVMDPEGKKMSKSIGNVVDPFLMIEKYGVDALRYFMYTVNQPGEAKNFDEKTVDEIIKKIFNLLLNVVKFYEMYAPAEQVGGGNKRPQSANVLDQWILARLEQMVAEGTESLDAYRVLEPARSIRDFIDDLSTWYLRRSRERFKSDDREDKKAALETTRYVLLELSKFMAPFMPFVAESVYQRAGGNLESVHLEKWTTYSRQSTANDTLQQMEEVRKIVTLGLEARAKAGIKIRQPLGTLKVKSHESKVKSNEGLMGLIKDEINVKEVVFDGSIGEAVVLDTTMTPELKIEGQVREFIRQVQDLRKTSGLEPADRPVLTIQTNEIGKQFVESGKNEIMKKALLTDIVFGDTTGTEATIDEMVFTLSLKV